MIIYLIKVVKWILVKVVNIKIEFFSIKHIDII